MANFRLASTRKRGPQPSSLSVRLFLLDPDKKISKVTKQTCSRESIQQLMQKGYGPPQPEHCASDDKVEFPLALTNEQFKEKLVEIYPKLENSCFVLMKADKNNKLEELNPGTCCFKCYTPENVYHSERGQGRLYIQKIAESEISHCTHGVSPFKRLCQQQFVPIQPRQSPAVCTITGVFTQSSSNIAQSVATPINRVLPSISGNNGIESRPLLLVTAGALPALGNLNHTSGNIVPQSHLSSAVVSQTTPSQPVQSSVNVRSQNQLLPSPVLSPTEDCQPLNAILRTPPWPPTVNQPTSSQPGPTASTTAAQSYANMTPQNLLPTTTIVSRAESNPLPPSSMVTQGSLQTPPDIVSQTVSRPAGCYSRLLTNMVPQNLSPSLLTSFVARNTSTPQFQRSVDMVTPNHQLAQTTNVSQTVSRSGAQNINMQPQSQLPAIVSASTPPVCSGISASSAAAANASTPPFQSTFNMATRSQLPLTSIVTGAVARQGQFPRSVGPEIPEVNYEQLAQFNALVGQVLSSVPTEQDLAQMGASLEPWRAPLFGDTNRNLNTSMLQAPRTGSRMSNVISGLRNPIMVPSSMTTSQSSLSNSPAFPSSSNMWVPYPGLATLAEAAVDTVQRERRGEYINSDANTPNVQGNQELATQNESLIDSFLENVKSTGKLEVSLGLLDNDDLLEKLNASTINIRTVEIESTCKLQQVLRIFSLPSCLTVLRIKDNNLNYEDIYALFTSLRSVNQLHELDLSGTTFRERSSSFLLSVLISCSNLTKLCLTDNSLTNQDINCLIPAFESMKNLVNLNLSKSNLTETQANDILQKQEGKSIVSLDLSQNALQGNKITIGICHLRSLEELNLSHNHIRFFPLPELEKQHDLLPVNIKNISLSSNHMTPSDICRFCTLVSQRSVLLKLNLDFNHIGGSIWSLCSLRVKHLKVLNLAHAAICGPAVQGLAFLLSLIGELEELDLSSNNLMLADFQQLRSPLSNLTQLKRLNLSNNPDGISVVLHEILPSLKNLEELRLSNVHLNGDDCTEFCKSLASLKGLKYLNLSMNAIGPNGTKALVSVLKEFPLLEGLDMSKSCIKDYEISVLCKGLVHLNKLTYLNLSGNRIDVEVLGDNVILPPMVEELIFSDIIHGGKLFTSMTPLQHLRKLHLSEIRLRPCDVEALTAMLSSFPLLEDLVLAKVVGAECDKIFSAIKSLKNIKKIDLTCIQLQDGNVIAEMLSSLLSLEELVLANINVVDIECEAIFNAIKSFKKLKKIDLTGIKIPDGNAIAEMLSSLLSLEELVLANVHVANKEYKIIFSKIKFLKALRKLNFSDGVEICNENEKKDFLDMLSSLPFLEDIAFPRVKDADGTALTSLRYLKNLDLPQICLESCIVDLARVLPSMQLLEKLCLVLIDDDDEDVREGNLFELFGALVNLKYLKELNLEFIRFTQTHMEAFIEVLPSLDSLEKLLLVNMNYGDECERQLFAAVGKLRCLKELELSLLGDTGLVTGALADALPSLQLLEKLTLRASKCKFVHDENEKQFFAALRSLKYLKELDLEINLITQIGAETLAEVLPSLQLLVRLELEFVDFDERSQKQVFDALRSLKYLKKLNLDVFVISQIGAESLAEVLPSLQLLESLYMDCNNFDNGSEKQVFAALRSLKYLKELDLKINLITQIGAETLAEVLPSLQLLVRLALEFVDFDERSQKQVFDALRSLKYLKKLNLNLFVISQIGAESLAEVLPSLQLLESLYMYCNNFDNGSEKQVFAALRSLKYLKRLTLRRCTITKIGAESLTGVLSSLQLLEELTLNCCDISNASDQQLFTAVQSLSYLKELHLSATKISPAGATNLTTVLPSLRCLTCISLPDIRHDENGEFRRLKEAARQIPGLKIY